MVIFKNELFRVFILLFLLLLLLYNSYNLYSGDKAAIAPIIFQVALIVLILKKDRIVKGFIKIWSGLFMILFPGLQVIAQAIYFLLDGPNAVDKTRLFKTVFFVIFGLLIYYFTDKTIEIQKDSNTDNVHKL